MTLILTTLVTKDIEWFFSFIFIAMPRTFCEATGWVDISQRPGCLGWCSCWSWAGPWSWELRVDVFLCHTGHHNGLLSKRRLCCVFTFLKLICIFSFQVQELLLYSWFMSFIRDKTCSVISNIFFSSVNFLSKGYLKEQKISFVDAQVTIFFSFMVSMFGVISKTLFI